MVSPNVTWLPPLLNGLIASAVQFTAHCNVQYVLCTILQCTVTLWYSALYSALHFTARDFNLPYHTAFEVVTLCDMCLLHLYKLHCATQLGNVGGAHSGENQRGKFLLPATMCRVNWARNTHGCLSQQVTTNHCDNILSQLGKKYPWLLFTASHN